MFRRFLSPDPPGQTGGTPPVGTPPEPPAPGEPPAGNGDAGPPSYVTPEQLAESFTAIDEKLAKFTDGMAAMIRKKLDTEPPKAGDPPPTPPTPASNEDAVANLRAEYQFGRALDRAEASDKDKQRLERLFALERPTDPIEWLAKEMKDVATPNPNPGEPAPVTPAPTGAKPTGERATDRLNWTKADWMEDFTRNAPHPSNFHDIRNRPYFKKVSEAMQARMNDVRIYLGPPK